MGFNDYATFWQIGRDLLQGHYSSLSLYPLPTMLIFALFALFPPEVGAVFLTVSSLALLVVIFKRRALLWAWYVPILTTLRLGQLDVWCLWLYWLDSAWSLALLSLKPQLLLLAIPRLMNDRVLLKKTAKIVLVIYGIPTILYPAWIGKWLSQMTGDSRAQTASDSLLSSDTVILAFIVIAALTLFRLWHWNTAISAFNPLWKQYDYTLLAGMTLWLIPVSIAAQFILHQGAWWAMSLCGVVAGIAQNRREHGQTNLGGADAGRAAAGL